MCIPSLLNLCCRKKQPSKKVVMHSKVQERFCTNRKRDATRNQAVSILHFSWLHTAMRTQVEGPKKGRKKEHTHTEKIKHVVALLPPTTPPAYNITFTLLPQIHFIMAVCPTRKFEYAWGKRKKEPNFCQ